MGNSFQPRGAPIAERNKRVVSASTPDSKGHNKFNALRHPVVPFDTMHIYATLRCFRFREKLFYLTFYK